MNQKSSFTDEVVNEGVKQITTVLVVVFGIAWVFLWHKLNPWNPVQKIGRDIGDQISGTKSE